MPQASRAENGGFPNVSTQVGTLQMAVNCPFRVPLNQGDIGALRNLYTETLHSHACITCRGPADVWPAVQHYRGLRRHVYGHQRDDLFAAISRVLDWLAHFSLDVSRSQVGCTNSLRTILGIIVK